MRIEALTAELRTQTGLKESDQGAFVREVRDGSPAAQAEIVPGMVIDQVGEKKVAGVQEFTDAVADVQGPVMVHVIGIGVKVIPALAGPGAEKEKGDGKPAPEKPKGKRGGRKSAEKPTEEKPAAAPEGGTKDKPAGEGKP
jgi:membrane-associated protease RseP (regulator of RpoE activity)